MALLVQLSVSQFPCYLPSFSVYDAFLFFLCLEYTYFIFSFWMPLKWYNTHVQCGVWFMTIANKYFFSFNFTLNKRDSFHHWKVPCYFKYNSTFPKTFCRSVSYKYWHIQAMYPPTEQVEDHSQINFSVLLFQRKWISASSAFQCSPSSKLARCNEESDFCDNQKHGQTAFFFEEC